MGKRKLILVKSTDSNWYGSEGIIDTMQMSYLAMFLGDVISGSIFNWIKDLDNENQLDLEGELVSLEKRGRNIIIYRYTDNPDEEGAEYFESTIEQLKYILRRWGQALKEKPNKVIITQDDDGKISVDFED